MSRRLPDPSPIHSLSLNSAVPSRESHSGPHRHLPHAGVTRLKFACRRQGVLLAVLGILLLAAAAPLRLQALPEFSNFGFSTGAAARPWTSLPLGADGALFGTANEVSPDSLEFLLGDAPFDDTHDFLVQQVDVDTHIPPAFEGSGVPAIRPLADGTTLLIRDGRLLRLTTNAQPDLTFGNGTGQVSLPFSSADSERLVVELLSNGGLQLLNPVDNPVVVRLTATGLPDLSFGGGTGSITLPGRLLDTSPEGGLLSKSDDGNSLRRFNPDGSPVPGFSSAWKPAEGIYWGEVADDGRVWAMAIPQKDNLLFLLGLDGLPDASFRPRAGLNFGTHSFDQAGRGYFPVDDSVAFGDPSQGVVARFLADGTYDSSYRSPKHPAGANVRITDTRPDGTTLVIIGGRELIEIDPAGNSRLVYENQSDKNLVTARLFRGEQYILKFEECSPTGPTFYGGPTFWVCRESKQPFLLASDGNLRLMEVPGSLLSAGTHDLWFWDSQEQFESLKATLYRRRFDSLGSEAGWTKSGLFSRTKGIRVPLQRSGAVEHAAVVRGRTLPGTGRPWNDAEAKPFKVQFPVGKADAILELPNLTADPQHPLREYLLRLETSEDVALSSFTECRLRVLDDSILPVEGELKLTPYPIRDEQEGALLLYQPLSGKMNYVGLQMGLQGRWGGWPASENHVSLGSVWLTPVPASAEFPIFFKAWYP